MDNNQTDRRAGIQIEESDILMLAEALYERKKQIIQHFKENRVVDPETTLKKLREYIKTTIKDEDIDQKLLRNIDFKRSYNILYGLLLGHGYCDSSGLGYDPRSSVSLSSEQVQKYMIGYVMEFFLFHGKVPRDQDLLDKIDAALDQDDISTNIIPLSPERYNFVQFDESALYRGAMDVELEG